MKNAGESFFGVLSDEEQKTAREVLIRLVKANDVPGAGSVVTRFRVTRDELIKALIPEGPLARVVDGLLASKLVTEEVAEDGKSRLTLAHEMVIDHWERLRRWVDESWRDARTKLAETRQIARRTDSALRNDRALLCAVEAVNRAGYFKTKLEEGTVVYPEVRGALLRALGRSPRLDQYVFSNLGNTADGEAASSILEPASTVLLSPNGRTIAVVTPSTEGKDAGGSDDCDIIRLWDYPRQVRLDETNTPEPGAERVKIPIRGRVFSLAWSADSGRLAAGVGVSPRSDESNPAGEVLIWDIGQVGQALPLQHFGQRRSRHGNAVFRPRGARGVSARTRRPTRRRNASDLREKGSDWKAVAPRNDRTLGHDSRPATRCDGRRPLLPQPRDSRGGPGLQPRRRLARQRRGNQRRR